MKQKKYSDLFRVGKKDTLKRDFDPGFSPEHMKKSSAPAALKAGVDKLTKIQEKLYADNRYSVLCIFQAMDAAGKDGTIKHVLSGLNPQGCEVFSFKVPSNEELDHDYLWRYSKNLPERGRFGIFNRSYYEEVLVVRVHPNLLELQQLPSDDRSIWKRRFDEINNFERYLTANGTIVLKFFLHLSKEEQKLRFLDRIEKPEKNWKFSLGDVEERKHWDEYQDAAQEMLSHTSTEWAPWYVIPADKKWFTHLAVSSIIQTRLEELDLSYPQVTKEQRAKLMQAKQSLEAE